MPLVSCPPRPRHTHLRVTTVGARGSVGSSLPFFRRAHILTQRAPRVALAREHTRALRAHVRHFSFFAFTSSPLCRKSLYDSRFGVKDFSKMLHRGEASAPHPPSACNRPPNDRSIRTHPGGREPRKAPCKMPKNGGNCTKVPDRGGEGMGEGIPRKAFTPYGLNISALMHGG